MSAPAYLIVAMHITDPERYKEYMAKAPAFVKAFGGEYIFNMVLVEGVESQPS